MGFKGLSNAVTSTLPYFHQWVPRGKKVLVAMACKTAHVCFHRRKWVHTRLSEKDRTQGHTRRNRGRFERGGITTLDTYCTFTNIPGPGIRTAYFAAFGSWLDVLSKNAESLRNSDALMRVAVPKASRPRWAALLYLQLGDVAVLSLCAQYFLNVRGVGGITTLGALCVFSKRWTAACQSG